MADEKYRRLLKLASYDTSYKESVDHMAKRLGIFRQLKNEWDGHLFYESSFNPDTGTLIRMTEEGNPRQWFKEWYPDHRTAYQQEEVWRKAHATADRPYGNRRRAYSPVPETVDVAITTWCNHGCSYCYTDATTQGTHAPLSLVRSIITGFDQPPYQIAYGGGSPTQHPEIVKVLELTRELGTVPNYTTEGQNLTDYILDATQALCGGIALTFHAFRGIQTFTERYQRIRTRFFKQLNVHLIADKDVATNLDLLTALKDKLGTMSIVLLAYYPDVGRSGLDNVMPKKVYSTELPVAIKRAVEAGHRFAFSEGLLPYFLSRPEIGVDTTMALPTEGHFSCYIDVNGRMSHSSFSPPFEGSKTIYEEKPQVLWKTLYWWDRNGHSAAECYACAKSAQCSAPNDHHYLACRYASHNDPEAQPRKPHNYDDWW